MLSQFNGSSVGGCVFQVEDIFPEHPPYTAGFVNYAVDHERGVWLEYIGASASSTTEVFRFFWNGVPTLVKANVFASLYKNDTAAEGQVSAIVSFGYGIRGAMRTGLRPDPLDRDQVTTGLPILADAQLDYGTRFDGALYRVREITATFPEGPMRRTRADSGYTITVPCFPVRSAS